MSKHGDLITSLLERARAAIERDILEELFARDNGETQMNTTADEILATLHMDKDLHRALATLQEHGPMTGGDWCWGPGQATEKHRQWLRKHGLVRWDKSARKWKTTRAGECALLEVEGWRP